MHANLKDYIRQMWHEIEDAEPDISTERLLEMTAERASFHPQAQGRRLDASDVAEALAETENKNEKAPDPQ